MPYWDHLLLRDVKPKTEAAKDPENSWRCGIPKIFEVDRIKVRLPGQLLDEPMVERENPLRANKFPALANSDLMDWGSFDVDTLTSISKVISKSTVRAPGKNYKTDNFILDENSLHKSIANNKQQNLPDILGSDTFNHLAGTYPTLWHFATTQLTTSNNRSKTADEARTTLEGVCTTMQEYVGRGASIAAKNAKQPQFLHGHIAQPDYAAFDPMFFLIRCNIDRLFQAFKCDASNPVASIPRMSMGLIHHCTPSARPERPKLDQRRSGRLGTWMM